MKIIFSVVLVLLFGVGNLQAKEKRAQFVEGEYVVKLKNDEGVNFLNLTRSLGVRVESNFRLFKKLRLIKIENRSEKERDKIIKALSNSNDVQYVEPNFLYYTNQNIEYPLYRDIPNDPRFRNLWGLSNVGQNGGKIGSDINAPEAWNIDVGSHDILVAVIDSGIDYNHEDLKDNMWKNPGELDLDSSGNLKETNGIDDDGNGYVDDIYGWNFVNNTNNPFDDNSHGTHCAGTIGAVGNNGIGVAGVSWRVKLMAIKFLSSAGSGTLDGAIRAVEYGIINKANILSNSWGGGGYSQALFEAIEEANRQNILFVAAAGNANLNNDLSPQYPASYKVDNVISVAASDSSDNRASFSCYGKTSVHVAAPGVAIQSTLPGSKYGDFSGTSMATPHVAGAAAVLLSYFGDLSPMEIKEKIMVTSDKLRSFKGIVKSNGRLNLYNALTGFEPEPPWPVIDPSLWKSISHTISSPHPYNDNTDQIWEIKHEGAKYIRVNFKKIELEAKYDFIIIYDSSDNEIEKITGTFTDYWSEPVEGDILKIRLKTDNSITKYGFDVELYQYVEAEEQ